MPNPLYLYDEVQLGRCSLQFRDGNVFKDHAHSVLMWCPLAAKDVHCMSNFTLSKLQKRT
jgi:hypothetical protein